MILTKTHMKKYIFILFIISALIFLIWKLDDKAEYDYEVESFVLINDIPYMVSDGTAYYWDNDNRSWLVYKEDVKKLFRGETISILRNDGTLEIGREEYLDMSGDSPLLAQYSADQAGKLMDISQNTSIRTLNGELSNGSCWALCEDGSMLINPGGEYIPFEIPNEKIKDISECFILTEEGNVYEIENPKFEEYSYKRISEDKFISIDAGGNFCVGLREDNTVVAWSPWEPLDLTDWNNVKEVAAGWNYCIGLTTDGKVLYADYIKEREADISKQLKGIKAEHVTCCFQTIAVMKKDLTVKLITYREDF